MLIQGLKIGGCVLGGALVILWIAGIFMKGQRYFLYQPATGQSQKVKDGYSYPYAFFGPFVPLFYGHVGGFFLTLVIELVTLGFGRLVMTFLYNGMYIKWLNGKGYIRTDVESRQDGDGSRIGDDEPHSFSPSIPQDGFNGGAYQNTDEIFQPANARFEDEGDEGETVALSGGSIQGISGMYQDAVIPMKIDETVVIGRDSDRCNLVIEEKAVSRRHCAIQYDAFNCSYRVRDYSTYGVFLEDGTRLPSNQEVELKAGTKIRLGSTNNVFLLT